MLQHQHVLNGMLLPAILLAIGCDAAPPREVLVTGDDDDYMVAPGMLAGARFTSRTGRDRRYDDLQWEFRDETFLITAGENALPPELAIRLLPRNIEATEISGVWAVAGNVITFTEIAADGKATNQPPRTLRTFITPILRIEAGQQYKFSRQPTRHPTSQSTTGS